MIAQIVSRQAYEATRKIYRRRSGHDCLLFRATSVSGDRDRGR